MTTRRQEQLSELIAHELSELIRTRMKDPRVGFASITEVDLSADLRHAKVFVSVFGTPEEQRATLRALEHGTGFLRHELAQRLVIRYTPEIVFRLDDSIAHGAHILQLMQEVQAEGQARSEGAAGDGGMGEGGTGAAVPPPAVREPGASAEGTMPREGGQRERPDKGRPPQARSQKARTYRE
jgi:ribosome-binding factor A